jgi:CHAD domain-containing protein
MAKTNIPWDDSSTASANARARLPAMVQAYFEEGRKLTGAELPNARMHRFRLETKGLRYTLELFRACYGPGLERYLAALRKIQDCLGAINDYETSKALIAARLPRTAPERIKMERVLTARAKRKSLEFRRYWQQTFDKPGVMQRWRKYFSRV